MAELFELFWLFFKVGLFTFGGGYAMLPMLQTELVEKRKWLETQQLMDFYAIGQCTPGIISVNTATFTGHNRKGNIGAIFATLGIVSPSLIIITIIAALISDYSQIAVIGHAFGGIKVAVSALIIVTIADMIKNSSLDWLGILIILSSFVISTFTKISPILIIVVAFAVGALFGDRIRNKKRRREEK